MFLNRGKYDGGRLISESTYDAMTKVQSGDLTTGFTPGMCWGLGVNMVREPRGITAMLSPGAFGHGGVFGTQGWIDPQKGVFTILLLQREGLKRNADDNPIRKEFQTLAMGALQSESAEKATTSGAR
jgi:CubicO group peptidase (beta-lactamase class C family)